MSGLRVLLLTLGAFMLVTVAGFVLLPKPEPLPPEDAPPPRAARPAATPAPPLRPARPLPSPSPAPEAAAPPRAAPARVLAEAYGGPGPVQQALQALEPVVQRCFQDAREHLSGPASARVAFRLESGGGRGRVASPEVQLVGTQDPYLRACVEDALEEVPLPSPEAGTHHAVRHEFAFSRASPAGTGRRGLEAHEVQ